MSDYELSDLQTIRPASIADQIYINLRSAILTGKLSPGQRLTELEIAARMGTSQAPVREALQRLENDGLVEKQPRSGTFVTIVSLAEIQELFQIRALVERFAIRRTVKNINPQQIAQLEEMVLAMHRAAMSGNLLLIGETDMGFHRRLCEWSGSNGLLRAWMPLYSQIQRFITQNHPHYFTELDEIARLHGPIIDALRSADADLAEKVIEEHILLTFHKLR